MISTYEESVLYYVDDDGRLDLNVACEVLNEHSALLTDYLTDTNDHQLHAETILEWLGY